MISFKVSGTLDRTKKKLRRMSEKNYLKNIDEYAREGLKALQEATPVRTGLTAGSWYYTIVDDGLSVTINWCNSNAPYGPPVALMIQYGHVTRGGTYVEGIDYINPALAPVFRKIAEKVRKEVTEG